jgi:hypothetical protein
MPEALDALTTTGINAANLVGFAPHHEQAFQQVADEWNCVIMTRETGWVCQQLIVEGYGSKGFHVKSKSCNWGPVAGFLLEDIRLTKTKDLKFQYKEVQARFQYQPENWRVPLVLSDERVGFLSRHQERFNILEWREIPPTSIAITAARPAYETLPDEATSAEAKLYREIVETTTRIPPDKKSDAIPSTSDPLLLKFILVKTATGFWEVYFAPGQKVCQKATSPSPVKLIPVMALTDPGNWIPGYKGAITGDYDLFAVFAHIESKAGSVKYEPDQLDLRIASIGTGSRFEEGHPEYGHITQRLLLLIHELNKAIYQQDVGEVYKKLYGTLLSPAKTEEAKKLADWVWLNDEVIKDSKGSLSRIEKPIEMPKEIINALPPIRKMVHHADEGGRPKAPGIEFPLIGFVPSRKSAFGISNLDELRIFLTAISDLGFRLPINPSWREALGSLSDKVFVPDRWADVFRPDPRTGKPRPIGVDKKGLGLSLFPVEYSAELSATGKAQPAVLLNGMKLLFDRPVGVYPVTLEPKQEEIANQS